jgi:hypothetical protein
MRTGVAAATASAARRSTVVRRSPSREAVLRSALAANSWLS